MRISDWSSDVCSSDLPSSVVRQWAHWTRQIGALSIVGRAGPRFWLLAARDSINCRRTDLGNRSFFGAPFIVKDEILKPDSRRDFEIGRASCRERVCQYG